MENDADERSGRPQERPAAHDSNDEESRAGIERLQAVLQRRPFVLFTDVDGTISTLAPTPGSATVSPRAKKLLTAIAERVRVVVISGRTLVDVRRMVGLGNVTYVGSHGLARWVEGREELESVVR